MIESMKVMLVRSASLFDVSNYDYNTNGFFLRADSFSGSFFVANFEGRYRHVDS